MTIGTKRRRNDFTGSQLGGWDDKGRKVLDDIPLFVIIRLDLIIKRIIKFLLDPGLRQDRSTSIKGY